MPRASQYLLEGYTYHLTHRCQDRQFLMRFARDRDVYRKWLREGIRRYHVPVYGYCITNNHVHIIAHADNVQALGELMQLVAGATAKQYNLRKEHSGSMWEHPYQCTVIQDGKHLFNCLCYVDMNMVRAHVVSHPREWRWSGFDELVGRRQRYRILDVDRLMQSLEMSDAQTFLAAYTDAIERRLVSGHFAREAHWTESLVVGSRAFVERLQKEYTTRRKFEVSALAGDSAGTWMVKEPRAAYGSVL